MRLARRYANRGGAPNVDVTPFLSLMVILIPFLMITAVFSRMTIVELEALASQRAVTAPRDALELRIWVREQALEVHHRGLKTPLRLTRTPDGQEHERLAELAEELKAQYPQSTQTTLLLEPQISYDELVQIMDAVRVRPYRDGDDATKLAELFPQITLGETPRVEPVTKRAE